MKKGIAGNSPSKGKSREAYENIFSALAELVNNFQDIEIFSQSHKTPGLGK